MNVNFFQWLRDGVRQSVLLGVSDAVDQIGLPEPDQDAEPTIARLLGADSAPAKGRRKPKASSATSRKRLGKSLSDMEPTGT
ncbi:MAG: hypothetical protein AAF802_14950 [Planctomycetota bacterium]